MTANIDQPETSCTPAEFAEETRDYLRNLGRRDEAKTALTRYMDSAHQCRRYIAKLDEEIGLYERYHPIE